MNRFVDELVAICRSYGLFEREMVCCGAVTVPQCIALQALLAGDAEVSALAGSAGVSTSAMTRLADGLERHGWVERKRSGEDRRRVVVALTPAGREEALRLRGLTEQAIEVVVARIPRAKRGQVLDSLRLLREAVEASRAELGEE